MFLTDSQGWVGVFVLGFQVHLQARQVGTLRVGLGGRGEQVPISASVSLEEDAVS